MSWPANFLSGDTITATRLNGIIAALSTWGGDVSANGNKLTAVSQIHGDANTILLYTNGAERFRIDSSGKVGISGTPSYYVHMQPTISNQLQVVALETQTNVLHAYWLASHNSDIWGNTGFTGFGFGVGTSHPLIFATNATEALRIDPSRNVGIAEPSPQTLFHLGSSLAVMTWDQATSTPGNPSSGGPVRTYMKGSKLIIQYNDGGTVRYKYLDLTGTGVTWVHTTTAP